MEQYRNLWSQYDVARIQQRYRKDETKAQPPFPSPPPKLDFEKLAKENGLSTGQTGLISQWETQALEIGTSLVGGRDPIWHYAFQSMPRFRPEESLDISGSIYLFWKTDEAKEQVPKFDDPGVRGRVLQTWKMIEARPLALKAATAIAAEVGKSKRSLKQAIGQRPDLKVVTPPAFSWITFGNVPLGSAPGAARISTIPGIDMAGEEFMRAVFHLTSDQTDAALNAPQTVAYVIQMTELNPSQDVLWQQFEVDDFSKYAPAAYADRQQIARAWLDAVKTSAGFEWQRKPDRMMMAGGPTEEDD